MPQTVPKTPKALKALNKHWIKGSVHYAQTLFVCFNQKNGRTLCELPKIVLALDSRRFFIIE